MRQTFEDHAVVKTLGVLAATLGTLAALVSVAFVIYDHVIKPRSDGPGVEQRSDQTVRGTKSNGQLAQAGRDVTQERTTVHGNENIDGRREQQSVTNPQQNGGSQNTQINGSQVDSLTINQAQKEKDPDTVEGAREALGRMGLKFDEEGFADANRESNLDAIKLYLRGGKSPNTAYSGTFMICLSLMNRSQQFPAILKLYQTQGREPLDFAAKVGPSPTPLQALMTRANNDYTMADIMFRQLAYEDDPYAKTMGRILWDSGADPSVLIHTLQSDKSDTESFLSNPQNRQNDAMQRKFGMINTSEELARTTKQLAFLKSVIPN